VDWFGHSRSRSRARGDQANVQVITPVGSHMPQLLFKCPRTAMNVQHWLDEPEPGDPHPSYASVVCNACTRIHFINSVTGKLLGGERES
jgi:hypothetical protein